MIRHFFKSVIACAAVALACTSTMTAQAPSGYYDSATGKNGQSLLSALESIVGPHTNVGYNALWNLYKTSDVTADGYIWDMYSTAKFTPGKNQCGSYSNIGDCYNREHSMPKSWFSDAAPMVSDAFHIVPTDGKVNGQRSNFPYGECASGTTLPANGSSRALGKLGTCTFPGYTGTVFEPDDQYKGDFARNYFYMAAAYNSRIGSWKSDMLAGNSYPAFTQWAINLLLKWSRQDPVSQKEIDRNNAVYAAQHNRNPFIDHPELAEYIWGNKTDTGWSPDGEVNPELAEPIDGTTIDLGLTATGVAATAKVPVKGVSISKNLTVTISGNGFSANKATITASAANAGDTITVTFLSSTAQDATGSLTIASDEAKATVTLKAKATSSIPALEATDITTESFTARWINVDAANAAYTLSVNRASDGAAVDGYPASVSAASQQHTVSGLKPNTAYTYTLSAADGRTSNTVTATTAAPTPILAFTAPEGGFTLSCAPGETSPVLEAGVYAEWIDEDITLTASGNFEVSLNKTDWSKKLTINNEGENFYLRIADTSTEGEYSGVLELSTANYQGEEVDVTATVGTKATWLETFENASEGGYWSDYTITGNMCRWAMTNAGVWGTSTDHPIDMRCVRLGKSTTASIAMADDKTDGASTVTFNAAAYGADATAELSLYYSTDAGSQWSLLKTFTVTAATDGNLNEYSCSTGGIAGNVRFKWERTTTGRRVNIDNIAITDYYSGVEGIDSDRTWDAYPASNGITLQPGNAATAFTIYDMQARTAFAAKVSGKRTVELENGVYVVTAGGKSKKVVVK